MNQVRNNFGVRIGFENVTVRLQFLSQRFVIFNDDVMNNVDFAVGKDGMCILRDRRTMRRPSCMCDTDHSGQVSRGNFRGEIRDSRHTSHAPQCTLLQDSYSARVVAAVLEAPQALGQQGSDIAAIHCSYDSAHGRSPDFAAIRTGRAELFILLHCNQA
jgi:hypothetical protein